MSDINKLETSTAEYYIEGDILYAVFKPDADVDLEAAKEGIDARKKLQNGKPMLVLGDTSRVWQITSEARKYSSQKEVDAMNKAMAVVTGSSFTAVTAANFYMKINKPSTPTKLFKSRQKALAWLESMK